MFRDKSFRQELWQIALPVTIQSVIMSLLAMTDQLMVGQLGVVAIAAAGRSEEAVRGPLARLCRWRRRL